MTSPPRLSRRTTRGHPARKCRHNPHRVPLILLLWFLHAPMVETVSIPRSASAVAAVMILALPFAAPLLGTIGVAVAITVVTVGLLVVAILAASRRSVDMMSQGPNNDRAMS